MLATLVDDMQAVRDRTLGIVEHLSYADLERQIDPLMSPLVWDLAHIAAYEDLWLVHRFAAEPLLHPELAVRYDAFETPRAVRGAIELLDGEAAFAYLAAVRERTLNALERRDPDPVVHEMVLRHELQHTETMLQAMRLGDLLAPGDSDSEPMDGEDGWVTVPAGVLRMGAGEDGFAYDNERPAHDVVLPAFRIALRPVTNAAWLEFAAAGGYRRREWWSADGWAWRARHHPQPHACVTAGDPDAPACHLSWYEADAYARAHGARLPAEAEWEQAARLDGTLQSVGRVWEWTADEFGPYPGFVAYPYREYSEIFYGRGYRVLRGGSWATDPRVSSVTFRNWDLPERRQIFAGVRLAADA
jgi:iron(II)-dependent oxidoreductase